MTASPYERCIRNWKELEEFKGFIEHLDIENEIATIRYTEWLQAKMREEKEGREYMIVDEIIKEIANKKNKRKDIAQYYFLLISGGGLNPIEWKKINKKICERWSLAGLKYIKELAWSFEKGESK